MSRRFPFRMQKLHVKIHARVTEHLLSSTYPVHRCVESLGTSPRTPISSSDLAIQQPISWINLFRSKADFAETEEAQRAINLLSAI
jgi:hypothetical protein